jgi:hypothetical protein
VAHNAPAAFTGLTLLVLSACTSVAEPTSTVATLSPPSDVPSVSSSAAPEAPRILARLVGRTGAWQATVGKGGDRETLTIRFKCTGGGELTVRLTYPDTEVSGTNACDSGARSLGNGVDNEDAVAASPASVTVEPDGSQRWSLFIARGPFKPGNEWPADAPEIEPGG